MGKLAQYLGRQILAEKAFVSALEGNQVLKIKGF
jgi:hypothetical protein